MGKYDANLTLLRQPIFYFREGKEERRNKCGEKKQWGRWGVGEDERCERERGRWGVGEDEKRVREREREHMRRVTWNNVGARILTWQCLEEGKNLLSTWHFSLCMYNRFFLNIILLDGWKFFPKWLLPHLWFYYGNCIRIWLYVFFICDCFLLKSLIVCIYFN